LGDAQPDTDIAALEGDDVQDIWTDNSYVPEWPLAPYISAKAFERILAGQEKAAQIRCLHCGNPKEPDGELECLSCRDIGR
jgi:hypothetical protein